MSKPKLALILGSGFSKEVGLPTTNEIPIKFLETPKKSVLSPDIEEEISNILKDFWKQIFNFTGQGGTPSLEDHFTLLDLAANSGHHLGKYYNPKRLRAIRRMSIHRIFSLVTAGKQYKGHIRKMLLSLNTYFDLSIITLNWDIVVERHLEKAKNRPKISFYYPIETFALSGKLENTPWPHTGIPLIKMHGSTNWVYCDCCKRIYAGRVSSTAINRKIFFEEDDVKLFRGKKNINKSIISQTDKGSGGRDCLHCGNKFAGRVATFSYRKAFSIAQFQTIWERAHAYLREADIWLIIGYSMPEADFDFFHLLKSAQLARKNPRRLPIEVVIKESSERSETKERYKASFGLNDDRIYTCGLEEWINMNLNDFCKG